jgi:hypothetical protein
LLTQLENIISAEEGAAADLDSSEYGQTETMFVKLPTNKKVDLKLEHFDDLLLDSQDQGTFAGLDSFLIDEEFLYLDDEQADKIYQQLKQRQMRRRNMEETERLLTSRIRDLEAMATSDASQKSQNEGTMLAS